MYKGYHRAATMKKVLLHICCGICAGGVVEKLRQDGYKVTGYFYNPNIYLAEEYERRLEVVRDASRLLDFELIAGPYNNIVWQERVQGLEEEPEGGKRCSVCFRVRLQKAADKARELGIKYLASTLSVSPHKNAPEINNIGQELSKGFLPYDFKKQNGFRKTMDFAKEHNFYRQHYCGCKFGRK
ncbi:MAG: epoxyqueuosine reductase QueH [Elusimicrobia bacterium]|nr:epoxyqueuosine reductase QueH [Elusimicrobiota bacterium]